MNTFWFNEMIKKPCRMLFALCPLLYALCFHSLSYELSAISYIGN